VPTHPALAPRASTAGEAASVGHAAGGDDRHGRDGVDDGRHQREGGHLTPAAAAGLPALRHDHVDACINGATRLLGATDGMSMQRATGMDGVDMRPRSPRTWDITATDSSRPREPARAGPTPARR
jgi:hypothetical protein